MEKKINVYNSNNEKFEANLILCFEVPEIDEKYIIYSFQNNGNSTNINIGNLVKSEDNKYYIKELDNEDEWEFVKKVMIQIIEDKR